MPEADAIQPDQQPNTIASLERDLRAAGLAAGETVCVHSSLRSLGWVAGGAQAVIIALLNVIGEDGTLMMPTHSSQNSDPAEWQNPPIPQTWWPIFRAEAPAYDPATTPTRMMGAIAEMFRTWPGVRRSSHPMGSFAALGRHAQTLTDDHLLDQMLGERSPVGRLYALDGSILLLGVTHGNNTMLHLAETRTDWPGKVRRAEGTAMLVDGQRQWVTFEMDSFDDSDFDQIGDSYEAAYGISRGRVGLAEVRFVRVRPLVDYAVEWIRANRKGQG